MIYIIVRFNATMLVQQAYCACLHFSTLSFDMNIW